MFIGLLVLLGALGLIGLQFYQQIWLEEDLTNGETELIDVPNVVGFGFQAAENRMRSLGFKVKIELKTNNEVEENVVFKQNPPSGQRLGKYEEVVLSVSQNIEPKVPSVRGRDKAQAAAILEEAGYVVIMVEEPDKVP